MNMLNKLYPLLKKCIFTLLIIHLTIPVASASNKPEKITVTNSVSWPPFSFINESGEPRGILVDLWQEISHQQGVELVYKSTSWAGTLTMIKNKEADIHAGLFKSVERDTYLDFSEPLGIPIATRLFISNKLKIDGLYDLGGIQVGVTKGGFAENFLKINYPEVQLQAYPNSKQIIEAAISGQIFAFAIDYAAATYYLHKFGVPDEFHVAETLYTERLRAAVGEGNQELLSFVNSALKEIPTDELDRIINKWINAETSLPNWLIPSIISAFLSLLIFFIILYVFILKKQVARKTKALQQLSEIDSLTQIYNRGKIDTEFNNQLLKLKQNNLSFSIILLDIDDFKSINDTHGHAMGDNVLIHISKILRDHIIPKDILGRWGGEEFIILCSDTNKEQATLLAEKLRKKIEQHNIQGIEQITASFGITEAKRHDKSTEIFIRADQALYHAKSNGKNRVYTL